MSRLDVLSPRASRRLRRLRTAVPCGATMAKRSSGNGGSRSAYLTHHRADRLRSRPVVYVRVAPWRSASRLTRPMALSWTRETRRRARGAVPRNGIGVALSSPSISGPLRVMWSQAGTHCFWAGSAMRRPSRPRSGSRPSDASLRLPIRVSSSSVRPQPGGDLPHAQSTESDSDLVAGKPVIAVAAPRAWVGNRRGFVVGRGRTSRRRCPDDVHVTLLRRLWGRVHSRSETKSVLAPASNDRLGRPPPVDRGSIYDRRKPL